MADRSYARFTVRTRDDPDCEFDGRIYYDLNDAGICWQKDE